jgi:hypothetical protein
MESLKATDEIITEVVDDHGVGEHTCDNCQKRANHIKSARYDYHMNVAFPDQVPVYRRFWKFLCKVCFKDRPKNKTERHYKPAGVN